MKRYLLLFLPLFVQAQQFTFSDTGVKDYTYASLDWGDIDNDGDLDLLIAGAIVTDTESTSTTDIYLNDGNGVLTLDTRQNLFGIHAGDSKFFDYDNDGDLDIVLSGISYSEGFYKIILYENIDGIFQQILLEDTGTIFGNIQIGDYDNDGDLDILITGQSEINDESVYKTAIFRNNDSMFEEIDITGTVPGIFNGTANWSDIDGDDDLDIIISGAALESASLRVYLNNDSEYSLLQIIEEDKYSFSSAVTADYDNDGDMDFAVHAYDNDSEEDVFIVYENDNLEYKEVYKSEGLNINSGAEPMVFVDFDNDGDLDIIENGVNSDYEGRVYFYKNNNNTFEKVDNTELIEIGGHSIAFVDVDNDLDSDFIVSGFYDDKVTGDYSGKTDLYVNNIEVKNTAPNPPTTLTDSQESGVLILNWEGATDNQTPTEGLKYLLQVGTSSGASDVASYVVPNNHWKIKGLDLSKNYFWRVKSIDTSGIMSDFSTEKNTQNLSVIDNVNPKDDILIYPNPVKNGNMNFESQEGVTMIIIYNMVGQVVLVKEYNQSVKNGRLNVSTLSKGMYVVECISKTNKKSFKVLIN